jgi:hypothetical protein
MTKPKVSTKSKTLGLHLGEKKDTSDLNSPIPAVSATQLLMPLIDLINEKL